MPDVVITNNDKAQHPEKERATTGVALSLNTNINYYPLIRGSLDPF